MNKVTLNVSVKGETVLGEVVLTEKCSCGLKKEWCEDCENSGTVLTDNGRTLINFMTPFMKRMIEDEKNDLIWELKKG